MNLKRFLPYMKHALMVVAMLTIVGISGCDDDDGGGPSQNIWELVQGNESLAMFEEQLLAGGFDAQLSGDGSFTLFAPSDQAMNTLLNTLGLDDFSSISPTVFEAVLSYHIAASQKLYSELSGDLVTLQGESITIVETTTNEKELDTGATDNAGITTKDIRATNGVIHIINTVIVPPSIGDLLVKTLGTVAQPLLLSSDFSTLSAGIQSAEVYALTNSLTPLLGTLENKGILIDKPDGEVITVFAPTNAVLAQVPGADEFTGEQWYGILLNHIVAGDYHEADSYTQFGTITTMAGGTLTVLTKDAPMDPDNGIVTGIVLDSNGDTEAEAQIAVLDVLTVNGIAPANNGYINVIAGFLAP